MNRNDVELLQEYAANQSEPAFAEIVRRYLDLVYSAALRQLSGDAHLAQDVTQAVFADLARKARSVTRHSSLVGWLYTSTRFAAAQVRRSENRRSLREQESHAMNVLETSGNDPSWAELRPVLDDAMHDLNPEDQTALLLRFFEHRSLKEVGESLAVSENTARMRIERALGRLRARLATRGIASSAAAIGSAMAQNAVNSAPAVLASRVMTSALSVEVGSAPWFGTLSSVAKAMVASLALVSLISFALLPKPASAPAEAGGPISVKESGANNNLAQPVGDNVRSGESEQSLSETFSGPELLFLDAETGGAVTNRTARLRGWERGSMTLVEKEVRLEEGRCHAPFDLSFGPVYWVISHVEGYADVRLRWDSRKGEIVPETYMVHLVRPVPIRGRVVDPDGNPVAGAEVAFGNTEILESQGKTEDHQLAHVTAITDAAGSWEIDRIAGEVVPYLSGSASAPGFTQSRVEVRRQGEIVRQLLDGKFVFHLGQAVVVNGKVVDPSGRPIAGAHVLVGVLDEASCRDGLSGPDGRFRIEGCKPGLSHVTASLDGYAPVAIKVDLESDMSPVKLRLSQGRSLRLRIVDGNGVPIAGASGGLDTLAGLNSTTAVPQVEFSLKSDTNGQIVWEHTPDMNLQFNFSASGYMEAPHIELRPQDHEQVITLSPALVLSGTVRDADSGELLPKFRLGVGWPEEGPGGSVQPLWTGFDRFWPTFTGGQFYHEVAEPVIIGTRNRGYIFRFEAEGYVPFVTRVYAANEGDVSMDIKLHKSAETTVTVYTPDGQVAANADVGLLAPGNRLTLGAGGFSMDFGESSAWLRRADASGHFVLPDDKNVSTVAIAHAEGYGETTTEQLRQTHELRLEPWARIEGQWRVDGKPVSNARISLELTPKPGRFLKLGASAFEIVTDSNGRFVFPQAPPGMLQILNWNNSGSGTGGTSFGRRELTFEARPGETNLILLGSATGSSGL
jgi:RNA polymerase sigma factor (sigma-70 family)